MKYGIIIPRARHWAVVDCDGFAAALKAAGLTPTAIDFGEVCRGLHVVVYEYGLFDPRQAYFALLGNLYAGNAVLFQTDGSGATIDFTPNPFLMGTLQYLADSDEAEAAIRRQEVNRPQQTVNGMVTWEWTP